MKTILYFILTIFVVLIIGSIVIEQFPFLQPIVDKGSNFISVAWDTAEVKYGTLVAGILVIGILLLFGDRRH